MPTPNNLYIQLTLILYEPVAENEMLVMKYLRADKGLNFHTGAGHCDPPHIWFQTLCLHCFALWV